VEQGGIFAVPDRRTPTYTKPMLHENGSAKELNRLDIKNRVPTSSRVEEHVVELLDEAWPRLDTLIVLDQVSEVDCGVVTRRARDHLAEIAARDPEKFVLADSREQIGLFRNVCVKPNADEMRKAIVRSSERGGEEPFPTSPAIFQTAGADGIRLHRRARDPISVPAFPVRGPIDICGAGDSTSAGITSAMVSGLTYEQAAAFGNLVASITIQQIGVTGTATPEQVRARLREVSRV
jgi:bifunctional ADP-heptose synthase (sugar kinase/adenylyltransferase)